MDKEIWATISGFEHYEISNMGRVRRKETRRIRALSTTQRGYKRITLDRGPGSRARLVHRLVAQAFISESDLQVNHKNGDKTDNRVGNLEYVTNKENSHHAYRTGVIIRVLTADRVLEIRKRLHSGEVSFLKLAAEFGVARTTISGIAHRKSWGHLDDGFPPLRGKRGASVGEGNGMTTLTEEDVRKIRRLYHKDSDNYTQAILAKMFSVTRSTIRNIVTRATWKHV